ncbi:carbohydrate-binding protein [Chitinophaga lutea]|uniref:Carbohydrate-binding protein n=1 Tax=Chitinophaga lutea TaxID=2488634 RepID=A0A3N4PCN7_9BACT|nr:cellulase family glycosylhydrolase [Chitinophaga lutea]RPE05996.1 carbohydrate-binding protein [Chitinophaga lutea]
MKTILSLAAAMLVFLSSHAQGFLRTAGTRIVNEKGDNVLLRGVGLGGWMLQEGYMLKVYRQGQQHKIRARMEELIGKERTDEFYEAWLANHTTRADIDAMKAWGFNSVRLPMHYRLYETEKGFTITDSLLAWCKANRMYLILDLHAAPGGQGNDLNIADRDGSQPSLWENEAHQQATVAFWRKVAARYKDEPWIAAYDIINEPNFGFEDPVNDKNGIKETKNEPLRRLMMEITKAIRETDQRHIVIIEGNGWGNNYNGVLPPWDSNMVLSFHKYWNYNNEQAISYMIRYRDQYNVPIWVGETGENSNVWFTNAIRLLESHNIGWAWWPLKKIGVSNPLEIPSNPDYQQVLAYWNEKSAPKPSAETAYRGVMALARATNFRNNVVHRDVLDAMLRQPSDPGTLPFKPNLIAPGAAIRAVDYDLGSNGYAYYDTDTANYRVSDPKHTGGNRGGAYRNDGVDIRSDDGLFITDIENGEWLQYTLNVRKQGKYTIRLEVAADSLPGKVSVETNGAVKAATVPVGQWQWVEVKEVPLKRGVQKLRVKAVSGGYKFREIRFEN